MMTKALKEKERVGKVMCRGVQLRGRPYRIVPEQDLEWKEILEISAELMICKISVSGDLAMIMVSLISC